MQLKTTQLRLPPDLDNPSINGRLLPSQLHRIEGGQLHSLAAHAWQQMRAHAARDGLCLDPEPGHESTYLTYEQQVETFIGNHSTKPTAGNRQLRWDRRDWYAPSDIAYMDVPGMSVQGWGLAVKVQCLSNQAVHLMHWMSNNAQSHGWRRASEDQPALFMFSPETVALPDSLLASPTADGPHATSPPPKDSEGWKTLNDELLLAADQVQATLDALMKRDPARLALLVAAARRRTPDRYQVLASSVSTFLPKWRSLTDLDRTALQLACQAFDADAGNATHRLATLLGKRWLAHVCPLFRSQFHRNAQAFLATLDAFLQEKLAPPISPRGLFNLTVLAYAYASDEQYEQLIGRLRVDYADANGHADNTVQKGLHRIAVAGAQPSAAPPALVFAPTQRLRIALCVSGQMRAYRAAWPTWQHLGFFEHEVDIFVHTWRSVGWRFPNPVTGNGAARAFAHAPFRQAYLRCGTLYGAQAMWEAYPSFKKALERECGEVSEADLYAVYGDQATVVVENDPGTEFGEDRNNQRKMLHKIEAAHTLAMASGRSYDLVVRIRPDLSARPSTGTLDLRGVAHASRNTFSLFGAESAYVTNNLYVDDQFALGAPEVMACYAQTLRLHSQAAREKWFCFNPQLVPHLTLAQSLLFQGIRFKGLPHARPGPIVGEDAMSREATLNLLLRDVGDTPRSRMDHILLEALA